MINNQKTYAGHNMNRQQNFGNFNSEGISHAHGGAAIVQQCSFIQE